MSADAKSKSRPALRQLWSERLRRFTDSGMTVLAFCRAEEVSVQSFYYREEPTAEQLSDWLPDRWLSRRERAGPAKAAS